MTTHLQGWLGPTAALAAWESDALRARFMPYPKRAPRAYARYAPWDFATKVALGGEQFPKHYPQEIGDCVSHGMKNALEYQQCSAIAAGELERFAYVYTPYLYAAGRMSPEGGNGQLGSSDGSLGSWQIAACQAHGVLFFADDSGLDYTGQVAKQWGSSKTIWKRWQPTAADNLVRIASKLETVEEVRDALCAGAAITLASSAGFKLPTVQRHGKSWYTGSDTWQHQVAILAYAPAGDTGPHPEAVNIKNSWEPKGHGPQLDGPPCSGWLELERLGVILGWRGTECYAVASWDGWPADDLDLVTSRAHA